MRRALITGSCGLVGSHLVAALLKDGGWEIFGTTRSENSLKKLEAVCRRSGVEWSTVTMRYVDMDDAAAVERVVDEVGAEVVFHTSAIVSLDGRNEQRMIESNVDMTRFVVDAMLGQKAKGLNPLLVHVSSIAAVGSRVAPELIDEGCRIESVDGLSAYSRSKLFSENEVWRGVGMGLRASIVNPSVVVGVTGDGDDRSGLQFVFAMIARGVPFYTNGVMGYVDVRDVARAMVGLASCPDGESKRYILNGATLDYKEFISIFGHAFGRRKPFIYLSRTMLKIGVGILEFWGQITRRPPLIARPMVGFMTDRAYYDGGLIKRTVIGFDYTPIERSADDVAKYMKR